MKNAFVPRLVGRTCAAASRLRDMSFITLSVPFDAAPGSSVQFTDPATQQTYTVAVPQGVPPGATFQVQLAAGERCSDSDVAAPVGAAAGKMALKATVATGKVTGRPAPADPAFARPLC